MPFRLTDSFRCADGIRGTGGGVLLPKRGTEIGLPGAFLGAGIPEGGRVASATPSDDRRADLRSAELGVEVDTLMPWD